VRLNKHFNLQLDGLFTSDNLNLNITKIQAAHSPKAGLHRIAVCVTRDMSFDVLASYAENPLPWTDRSTNEPNNQT
jgi:hypothetical protein